MLDAVKKAWIKVNSKSKYRRRMLSVTSIINGWFCCTELIISPAAPITPEQDTSEQLHCCGTRPPIPSSKVPLIHFSVASNHGNGFPLPSSPVPSLLSQTSTLKNSKSHNPTAPSGFISLSALQLFDYCVSMSQLLGCSPSCVLLKSLFVDSSSAVFCYFFLYGCHI